MEDVQPGISGVKMITRKDIYYMAKNSGGKDIAEKLEIVETNLKNEPTFLHEEKKHFEQKFSRFKSEMKAKWQSSNRTESLFLKNYHNWLQGCIEIPLKSDISNAGRPRKSFDDLSDCSKRRRTLSLRGENEPEAIVYAGQMALRDAGNVSGAYVLKDIMSSPTRGDKYRKAKARATQESEVKQLTPSEALSMFVEANLTRKQYEIIRDGSKFRYPCYTVLQKAKRDCCPNPDDYRVTETCAEVKLQALLDHTAKRLIQYVEEVLTSFKQEELASLELTYKWGCDGSQQAQYKQKFTDSCDTDANIFQSSMVPLQLVCKKNNKVIWTNPSPSSPRFCRPMRIRFVHETKDITNDEISYFKEQIKQLSGSKITTEFGEVIINHKMLFTMVDGKVCNAATSTASTMRCYICKATSKDFNDLTKFENIHLEVANLEFGLSILHARIRFFETLLHISYKNTVKKWQARTEAEKTLIKERKQRIQQRFRDELGLIVDVPKANFGNSNDGNTSRRFFSNAEISADITGIDRNLIDRFATILEVISSGHKIDIKKFATYCHETAKLYIELYSWYPMSTTIHKILIHGPTIVEHALLPIGTLSEEAAEARNKHFRQYRERFSRKFSRVECNMDVINRLLLTSDPYLSSTRPKPPKKSKPFKPETIEMLLEASVLNKTEEEVHKNNESEPDSDGASDGEGWDNSFD